ncbi:glycoside hydrolase family 125 protein [Butyrivibrio sp. WCE2006]|uniref:glycoside hydrolase family 125 protein n=1 Tax=Butyrivibrio sp. WCE2006 TaxID=1410611 RepID=UPI0005D23FE9|nr:glycoside hydrolase family 125 protein [Butyrivibrio sp. WCE2006]
MSYIRDDKKEKEIIAAVRKLSDELGEKIREKGADDRLCEMFKKCFVNTAETTMQCLDDKKVFLITGDIEAMWLRDSSAQVCHYAPFMMEDGCEPIKDLVKGVIKKQFEQICIDPYANAFNTEANGRCWAKDRTDDNPWDWERKYELDSLCYPVRLLNQYLEITEDESILDEEVKRGLAKILEVMETEQNHTEKSAYFFERDNCPPSDTLTNGGKGEPVATCGLIWSGFRPSDDACKYGYLIPSNFFAREVLTYMEKIADRISDENMKKAAVTIREKLEAAIKEHAFITNENGETIYVYETDGQGNVNRMDDANVPSLLSIPWITDIDRKDPVYLRTRADVLSSNNPYFYEGKAAKGIGSPHTPKDFIWHIALSMQGLTSADENERKELLSMLTSTDAGTLYMHEGFHKDDPSKYTRDWFAWSNSLFALFVLDYYGLCN